MLLARQTGQNGSFKSLVRFIAFLLKFSRFPVNESAQFHGESHVSSDFQLSLHESLLLEEIWLVSS